MDRQEGSSGYSLESSFGYRIGQLHRLIRFGVAPPLEPMGIAFSQVSFLAELFREEGQIQDQLSARLHIDKAATARALRQLETGGLVTRRTNPDNRRQKRVYLTDQMRRLEDDFFAVLQQITRRLIRGFTAEEKESALTLLDRMIRNLESPASGEGVSR